MEVGFMKLATQKRVMKYQEMIMPNTPEGELSMKLKLAIATLTILAVALLAWASVRSRANCYGRGYQAGLADSTRIDLTATTSAYQHGKSDAENNLAKCSLKLAHEGACWLPCANEQDCLEKNGRSKLE